MREEIRSRLMVQLTHALFQIITEESIFVWSEIFVTAGRGRDGNRKDQNVRYFLLYTIEKAPKFSWRNFLKPFQVKIWGQSFPETVIRSVHLRSKISSFTRVYGTFRVAIPCHFYFVFRRSFYRIFRKVTSCPRNQIMLDADDFQ